MITKTVRSPFDHAVGEKVEGCTILEKRVVIPPKPLERRRGVYDYLVEMAPAVVMPRSSQAGRASDPRPDSFTRATPDERRGGLIRRLPAR